MIIQELSTAQCAAVLAANRLARLACTCGSQPYVVPIYYAYTDGAAYAFTRPGRKLETMRTNPAVALLVEEKGEGSRWKSVVAEGRFGELPDRIGSKRQRDRAWSLLSKHSGWWEPGALKPMTPMHAEHASYIFFRITVQRMSGREAVDD